MPNGEKDRLGDKLRDAERAREDQYFKRRDRALLEKMRAARKSGEALRDGAEQPCPQCGAKLSTRDSGEGEAACCPACGWSAAGSDS